MSKHFNYYYGSQADQFSFIRIPKIMLTDKTFSDLSLQAKVLYGVLLDRMSLSRKNGWLDAENRVFIIYQIGEIQKDLGFSKKKSIDLLAELEKFGLLEKKRRGHGLPNILYVKSFMSDADTEEENLSVPEEKEAVSRGSQTDTSGIPATGSKGDDADTSGSSVSVDRGSGNDTSALKAASVGPEKRADRIIKLYSEEDREEVSGKAESFHDGLEVSKPTLQEVSKPELQEVSKLTPQEVPKSALHEVPKTTPQEVSKSTPLKNKTEINNTELSNIESNHISSSSVEVKQKGAQCDEMRCDTMGSSSSVNSLADDYRSLICRNIEFDNLLLTFPSKHELLCGIVDLILETLLCRSEEILIASSYFPAEIVKSRLLKLDYGHIRYVVGCLETNTTKVKNIRKYLLAALFNAPTTIDGYYQAEVNHNMPEFVPGHRETELNVC